VSGDAEEEEERARRLTTCVCVCVCVCVAWRERSGRAGSVRARGESKRGTEGLTVTDWASRKREREASLQRADSLSTLAREPQRSRAENDTSAVVSKRWTPEQVRRGFLEDDISTTTVVSSRSFCAG